MYKWWQAGYRIQHFQSYRTTNRSRITGRTKTQQLKKKKKIQKIQETKTYHEVHWTRPRTRRSIRLDKHIGLGLIHNFRVPRQSPSIARRPTYILQFEHYSQNLSDGLYGILDTSAVVESGTVEVVWRLWAIWVDTGRVGEIFGLDKKKKKFFKKRLLP